MGVVKREGIRQSIVNYIATAIGMVNVLYIYPKFLEPAELGLFQFLNNTALLLVPFSLFGLNSLVVKFFPQVEDKDSKHSNFLTFLLLLSLVGFSIFFAVLYLNRDGLGGLFSGDNEVIVKYFGLIAILVLLMQTNTLLSSYLLNFRKVVIPAIMNQLIKVVIPIAVVLRAFYDWSFESIALALFINYTIIFLVLIIYLAWLGELRFGFDFSKFRGKMVKEMRVFAAYGLLGSLGSVLATRIDIFMVANLSTLDFTGVYVIGAAIANVIHIPISSINSITSPLISKAWHDNDMGEIKSLYKKSSITLLIFSVLVFALIWSSIDDLYAIIPRGDYYAQGKTVVLLLGLAKIFDAATSVNSNILAFSPKFRFNLYFMLILAVVNTTLNVIFIPKFNIMGAALATMISIMAYNLLKFLFILKEFKLSPFTKNTLYVIGLGLITLALGEFVPIPFHPIVSIGVRSILLGGFLVSTIYLLNLSPDFNATLRNALARVGIKLPE